MRDAMGPHDKDDIGPHVLDRIPACLDGELAPAEDEAVRTHCRLCRSCGSVFTQSERVQVALIDDARAAQAESAAEPSLWPAVRARLHTRRPRFGFVMIATSSAAAVAGLVIGVLLGPGTGLFHRSGGETQTSAQWTQASWVEIGSLLADGTTTLDNVYLSETDDGGKEP
jgi:anti-sigma factor RsiW